MFVKTLAASYYKSKELWERFFFFAIWCNYCHQYTEIRFKVISVSWSKNDTPSHSFPFMSCNEYNKIQALNVGFSPFWQMYALGSPLTMINGTVSSFSPTRTLAWGDHLLPSPAVTEFPRVPHKGSPALELWSINASVFICRKSLLYSLVP